MATPKEIKLETISNFLKKASHSRHEVVRPSMDEENNGGVHVLSEQQIKRGDEILSCFAAAIALDPPYRDLCAYCARCCNGTKEASSSRCQKCFMVSICQGCQSKGAGKWHVYSGECKALTSIVCATHNMSIPEKDDENKNMDASMISLEMVNGVDSTYVLTIRLLVRRWSEKKMRSPFPSIDWPLLDELYMADLGTPDEKDYYDHAMNELCGLMRKWFCWKRDGDDDDPLEPQLMDGSWINKVDFEHTLRKVIGCSHAVTDVTAPLGCQCFGRALFLEHSFYNHSCTPNSFLSCRIMNHIDSSYPSPSDSEVASNAGEHECSLNARLHCIQGIAKGQSVTISYIPTSGLSCDERRQRLKESYGFMCNCEACAKSSPLSKRLDQFVDLPNDCDVECIRQMQFSCNQQLLDIQRICASNIDCDAQEAIQCQINEIECCISTIHMNKRGIKNQNIPKSHEVSIESHRLLAKALSLSGDVDSALREYASFRDAVETISKLFDPVARATTLLEFAIDLQRVGKVKEYDSVLGDAFEYANAALGGEHEMVLRIEKKMNGGRR
jgi:hypothetical protein